MSLILKIPKEYGLLLDHDPRDNRRVSVTLASKTPRKNGRLMQYATGTLYQRCFQHMSTILWNYHGDRPHPQEGTGRQYHPITEEAAVQIRLLLDAIRGTVRADKAERLAGSVSIQVVEL